MAVQEVGGTAGGSTAGGEKLGPSERLLAVRQWRRLSQRDVARELGLSRKTISRIENDYVAHANTRARVRRWLEKQEEAAAAAAWALTARRRVTVSLAARRAAGRELELACERARGARGQGLRSEVDRCSASPAAGRQPER